jgi:hypothetical protein
MLGNDAFPPGADADHPLETQLSRLRAAFGKEAD